MSNAKVGRLVSPQVRLAARKLLARFSSYDGWFAHLAEDGFDLGGITKEWIAALADELDGDSETAITGAAFLLYHIFENDPTWLIDESGLKECAERALVAGLESTDEFVRTMTMGFLTLTVKLPANAEVSLKAILNDVDSDLRLAAATLLLGRQTNSGEEDIETQQADSSAIVLDALRSEDPSAAALAGCAMIRLGLHKRLAMQRLIEVFDTGPELLKPNILTTWADIGMEDAQVAETVRKLVWDRMAPSATRRQAAATFAIVTRGTNAAIDELSIAIKARDLAIILGTVEGVIATGESQDAVAVRLADLLSDQVDEFRMAASQCLMRMKGEAFGALGAIIDQISREAKREIRFQMIDAVAAIGRPAVPALMELVEQQQDTALASAMAAALVQMGEVAAEAIGNRIAGLEDSDLRSGYILMLSKMGLGATPALLVLCEILDATEDPDVAFCAVETICNC